MRKRWAAVLLTSALAGGAYARAQDEPAPTVCNADGLIGPDGESFGRSHSLGCQFVDDRGELVRYRHDGQPLCYDDRGSHELASVVDCELPWARPPG